MNQEQIAKLKELARKAQIDGWPFYGIAYQKAANPDVVLELIALVERTSAPVSVMDDIPQPPEMEVLADLPYAQQTPEDWDADYRATWQKLQVAERNKMQWRTYALGLHAILTKTAAAPQAHAEPLPKLPSTPDEVIAFIGSNFDTSHMQGDKQDWRYKVSVHDLLTSFAAWAEIAPDAAHAERVAPKVETVVMDGHQLREALNFLNPGGNEEPDELDEWLVFGVVQHQDDDGMISTGLCCWNDDTDGVYPLTGNGAYAAPLPPDTVGGEA